MNIVKGDTAAYICPPILYKMKYILVVIIVAVALIGIGVSVMGDVTDAQYLSKLLVSNNSTTEANQVALAYSINTTAMADSAMLNTSATDVILQDVAGVSQAVMPGLGSNPWIMYIDTIGGNTQQGKFMYTGGSIISDNLVYFPGPGALKVTDNDSMELQDVFSLSLTDVLLKDSGPVFDKAGAVDGDYDSATENLSVQVTEGTENVTLVATGIDQSEHDIEVEQVRNSLDNGEWWLWGWEKRIAFTIDESYIDSDLTYFPILVSVNSTDVFDELGANGLKIAVTEPDKQTQLYVDEVSWDVATHTAELWVSRSGWVISSTVDTVIYLYYDNSQPDNTTYVGLSGGTAAQSVWNSSYKLVDHLKDNTASTTFDSTSNNRDGAKVGAGEPAQTNALIGKGQQYDNSDDKIAYTPLAYGAYTFEAILKNAATNDTIFATEGLNHVGIELTSNSVYLYLSQTTSAYEKWSMGNLGDGNYHHLAVYNPGTNPFAHTANCYIDGVAQSLTNYNDGAPAAWVVLYLGKGNFQYGGIIDEVRISSAERSVGWLKATYYACMGQLTSMTGTEEWEYTLSLLVDDNSKDSVAR